MKISRYTFTIQYYGGDIAKNFSPKFRGILGSGLKYLYCKNYYEKCENCSLREDCKYLKKFKPVEINLLKTIPYSIYSRQISDKEYKVVMTIINNHISLKEITDSFVSIKEKGIGKNKYPYIIKLANSKNYNLDDKWISKRIEEFKTDYWKLTFVTPVNFKKELSEHILLSSIINRAKFLSKDLTDKILTLGKAEIYFKENKLLFKKQYRFSEVSDKEFLNISGYRGEILVKINNIAYLLLKIAEIIHIGKFISYGCGKIKLDKIL